MKFLIFLMCSSSVYCMRPNSDNDLSWFNELNLPPLSSFEAFKNGAPDGGIRKDPSKDLIDLEFSADKRNSSLPDYLRDIDEVFPTNEESPFLRTEDSEKEKFDRMMMEHVSRSVPSAIEPVSVPKKVDKDESLEDSPKVSVRRRKLKRVVPESDIPFVLTDALAEVESNRKSGACYGLCSDKCYKQRSVSIINYRYDGVPESRAEARQADDENSAYYHGGETEVLISCAKYGSSPKKEKAAAILSKIISKAFLSAKNSDCGIESSYRFLRINNDIHLRELMDFIFESSGKTRSDGIAYLIELFRSNAFKHFISGDKYDPIRITKHLNRLALSNVEAAQIRDIFSKILVSLFYEKMKSGGIWRLFRNPDEQLHVVLKKEVDNISVENFFLERSRRLFLGMANSGVPYYTSKAVSILSSVIKYIAQNKGDSSAKKELLIDVMARYGSITAESQVVVGDYLLEFSKYGILDTRQILRIICGMKDVSDCKLNKRRMFPDELLMYVAEKILNEDLAKNPLSTEESITCINNILDIELSVGELGENTSGKIGMRKESLRKDKIEIFTRLAERFLKMPDAYQISNKLLADFLKKYKNRRNTTPTLVDTVKWLLDTKIDSSICGGQSASNNFSVLLRSGGLFDSGFIDVRRLCEFAVRNVTNTNITLECRREFAGRIIQMFPTMLTDEQLRPLGMRREEYHRRADVFYNRGQNTHTTSVHTGISSAIRLLRDKYKLTEGMQLELVYNMLAEIKKFPIDPSDPADKVKNAVSCVQYRMEDTSSKEGGTGAGFLEVLALVWSGLIDPMVIQMYSVQGGQPVEKVREDRIRTLICHLYEANREYALQVGVGDTKAKGVEDGSFRSCAGGTFNQIVDTLNYAYPGIEVTRDAKEKLKGLIDNSLRDKVMKFPNACREIEDIVKRISDRSTDPLKLKFESGSFGEMVFLVLSECKNLITLRDWDESISNTQMITLRDHLIATLNAISEIIE